MIILKISKRTAIISAAIGMLAIAGILASVLLPVGGSKPVSTVQGCAAAAVRVLQRYGGHYRGGIAPACQGLTMRERERAGVIAIKLYLGH